MTFDDIKNLNIRFSLRLHPYIKGFGNRNLCDKYLKYITVSSDGFDDSDIQKLMKCNVTFILNRYNHLYIHKNGEFKYIESLNIDHRIELIIENIDDINVDIYNILDCV